MQTQNKQTNTANSKASNQPTIPDQIVLLECAPTPENVMPVLNPPIPSRKIFPLPENGYRGNKPYGGLWTSSYTPDASCQYRSDWERALCKNPLIIHKFGPSAPNLPGWTLRAKKEVKVLTIDNLAKAICFTNKYHLGRYNLPKSALAQIGPMRKFIKLLVTNWRKACVDYDCIHLTSSGFAEVEHYKLGKAGQTAFNTWDCESALWSKWCFNDVDISSDCVPIKRPIMAHYTVTTGNMSYPRKVSNLVIDRLRPLVANGGPIPMPTSSPFSVSVTHFTGGAVFSIHKGSNIFVSCVVAFSEVGQGEAWMRTQTLDQQEFGPIIRQFRAKPNPTMPNHTPWLSVVLMPSIESVSRDDIGWFADFEQCMAWAIMAERG
jgi:hypothetical protein